MADQQMQHLLRRAGFGSSPAELSHYSEMSYSGAVDALLNYDQVPDDVDSKIGTPGYVGVTAQGPFQPNANINHARQRWLFRMVHSQRPLQEKMTLFWHNHFATGYTKVQGGTGGGPDGTRLMAAKASEDAAQQQGQIELFRNFALGNFKDLLVEVAKDPAISIWLDGRTNTKNQPQENFGREIMELFTMGVGNYTEPDVYAAARVFTGWNYTVTGGRGDGTGKYAFVFNQGAARDHRQDVQLSHLFRRQQDDSGPLCRARHAGRPRSDRGAGRQSQHGALSRQKIDPRLRQRALRSRSGARGQAGVHVSLERVQHEDGDARAVPVARNSPTAPRISRATRGRWSSWPAPSKKWAGPATP